MLDLQEFLLSRGIEAVDRGPNVRRGTIAVKCPFCRDDPSQHLTIRIEGPVGLWGCWRDRKHSGSGRNIGRLWNALGLSVLDQQYLHEEFRVSPYPEALRDYREPAEEIELRLQKLPMEMRAYLERRLEYANLGSPSEYLEEEYGVGMVSTLPGRIVFPVYEDNRIVNYVARAMDPAARLRYVTAEEDGGKQTIKDMIYNVDWRDGVEDFLVICEGVFDVISLEWQHSRVHAVGLFGNSASDMQRDMLMRMMHEYSRTFVLLDADAAWQAMDLANQLGAEFLPCAEGDPEGKVFPELGR